MRLHELTKAIDDDARLLRVTTEKARETIARLEPQVLAILYDAERKTYRRVVTDAKNITCGYKTDQMNGSLIVEVEMVGWLRKTPKLRLYGRNYGYDTITEKNEIFYASCLKFLLERD